MAGFPVAYPDSLSDNFCSCCGGEGTCIFEGNRCISPFEFGDFFECEGAEVPDIDDSDKICKCACSDELTCSREATGECLFLSEVACNPGAIPLRSEFNGDCICRPECAPDTCRNSPGGFECVPRNTTCGTGFVSRTSADNEVCVCCLDEEEKCIDENNICVLQSEWPICPAQMLVTAFDESNGSCTCTPP
ncbi:hypothetical protein NDN08_005918 [Rhodosorus marinus]|uniref:VWFC domain-containing protein n=1 Tax=Rhodosorus marinus TaxID=101924 RepID=A0AAV8UHZ9_9RHOD|nr:hypothetical protein NDN08_004236 [Rhodosorus marinus]KAJ8909226.1 hypothetical protein NDN08_005918 [Rhodosorus marinus]